MAIFLGKVAAKTAENAVASAESEQPEQSVEPVAVPTDPYAEGTEHAYLSPNKSLRTSFAVDGERHQVAFINGKLELEPHVAQEFDKILKSPRASALASKVRKVDKVLAEAEAKAWLAKQRPAAVKGGFSTDAAKMMREELAMGVRASTTMPGLVEEDQRPLEEIDLGIDMRTPEVVDVEALRQANEARRKASNAQSE